LTSKISVAQLAEATDFELAQFRSRDDFRLASPVAGPIVRRAACRAARLAYRGRLAWFFPNHIASPVCALRRPLGHCPLFGPLVVKGNLQALQQLEHHGGEDSALGVRQQDEPFAIVIFQCSTDGRKGDGGRIRDPLPLLAHRSRPPGLGRIPGEVMLHGPRTAE